MCASTSSRAWPASAPGGAGSRTAVGLTYTAQAIAESKSPSVQAVFVMNPTKVAQVKAVADAGEVMPQKSTFFYPKLASGLVLNPLVPSENV